MGFGDTFDPAGMLAYSNQLQEMKFRNRLYEMKYSSEERKEQELALKESMALDQYGLAVKQQQEAQENATGRPQGGATPSGGTSIGGSPMAYAPSSGASYVPKNPAAYSLAQAVKSSETSSLGDYGAVGKDNEHGAYQYTTGTWNMLSDEYSKQVLGKPGPLPMTPQNQDDVTLWDADRKLASGMNPNQFGRYWNSGNPNSNAVGVSKGGVPYNVPAYGQHIEDIFNKLSSRNMTADASGKTVPLSGGGDTNRKSYEWANGVITPPQQGGMTPQGQPQQFQNTLLPEALRINPNDSRDMKRAKLDAFDRFQKNQALVQQQQQTVLNNASPVLSEILSNSTAKDDQEGYLKSLNGIEEMYRGKPNTELAIQRIEEMKKIDPSKSGGKGNWAFKGPVTQDTVELAKSYKMPEQIINSLMGKAQRGESLDAEIKDFKLAKWDTVPKGGEGGEEKSNKPSWLTEQAVKAKEGELGHPLTAQEKYDIGLKTEGEKTGAGTSGRLGAEFNALKSAGVKYDEQTGKIDIKTLPPEIRNTSSMVASYQMPLPSGFALKSPYWQAVLAVTKDINPQFNALEYEARKKTIDAVNNPTFLRMRTNANILANPSVDPKTGKPTGESELDKIVNMRNEIKPGVFGSMAPELRKFNDWDQFIKYQVSEPAMAKFKGILIANVERLGSVYQGGGTATSDYKMKLAQEFLDPTLDKPAFKDLIEAHKESIVRTLGDYSNAIVGGLQGVSLQTPSPANEGGEKSDTDGGGYQVKVGEDGTKIRWKPGMKEWEHF